MNKRIVISLAAFAVLAAVAGVFAFSGKPAISNFEECEAAGYPVMESYPARCTTPDGREFVQTIDDASQSPITSGDDPLPGSSVHDLPIPDAVANARADLAARLSVSLETILILETKEIVWPNSCIGLGKEGQVCLQVLTPGYNVLMRAKGVEYRYHTNKTGSALGMVE